MNRKARLSALERGNQGSHRGPYVWQRWDQMREEALAAAGLPANAPNHTLQWREPQ
jgi:hypothetical protein